MAKRLAIAAIGVILAAVLIRAIVSNEPAEAPQAGAIDGSPHSWANPVSSDTSQATPGSLGESPVGDEEHFTLLEHAPNERTRLRAIEQAALAGNASAQFRLSNAMRHCVNVLAYSDEAVANTEDPLRRAYLLESREECRYFADRRDRLVDDAFEWERRALDAGDPGAQAMSIVTQIGNGELQTDQAAHSLQTLLASNDSFVFSAIATVSLWNGVTAESAAWHMLACENSGPPELCSIMHDAISVACTGSARCGNVSHDVDVAQYYMSAHPALFDVARGRYQTLKDQIQQGRASEIDLDLAVRPFSGG